MASPCYFMVFRDHEGKVRAIDPTATISAGRLVDYAVLVMVRRNDDKEAMIREAIEKGSADLDASGKPPMPREPTRRKGRGSDRGLY